jgi:hypothetical protein
MRATSTPRANPWSLKSLDALELWGLSGSPKANKAVLLAVGGGESGEWQTTAPAIPFTPLFAFPGDRLARSKPPRNEPTCAIQPNPEWPSRPSTPTSPQSPPPHDRRIPRFLERRNPRPVHPRRSREPTSFRRNHAPSRDPAQRRVDRRRPMAPFFAPGEILHLSPTSRSNRSHHHPPTHVPTASFPTSAPVAKLPRDFSGPFGNLPILQSPNSLRPRHLLPSHQTSNCCSSFPLPSTSSAATTVRSFKSQKPCRLHSSGCISWRIRNS